MLTVPERSFSPLLGYRSWGQVAGYFDGDGSVILKPKRHTISFSIEWADTSLAQLKQVRAFLRERAVYTQPKIQMMRGKYASYSLVVSFQNSVLALGRAILKYSFKKHNELLATIDYLEDRITGDAVIRRFNKAVEEGTRAGKIHKVSLPCRRSEGLKVARKLLAPSRSTESGHFKENTDARAGR